MATASTSPVTDPVTDLMEQALGTMAAPSAVAPMEQFWQAQDRILQATEAFSRGWFDRRHAATQAALDTLHELHGRFGDPAATMQAMAEWQQGLLKRTSEDMRDWVGLCVTCAGHIASAEVEAGKTVAREAAGTATKHATPV